MMDWVIVPQICGYSWSARTACLLPKAAATPARASEPTRWATIRCIKTALAIIDRIDLAFVEGQAVALAIHDDMVDNGCDQKVRPLGAGGHVVMLAGDILPTGGSQNHGPNYIGEALHAVRSYWQIENGLHYRRDTTLHEDATRFKYR